MPKYNTTWTKLDAGREGLWSPLQWRSVLEIASKYDGQNVYSPNAPIYDDLRNAFPKTTWKSNEGGSFHPVFRDYLHPWKYTKTLEVDEGVIRLTRLAKDLLSGKIAEPDVFLQMFRDYEEAGEKPFRILAAAFLEAKRPLSFQDVFFGVMQGYRPGVDNLEEALQQVSANGATPIRDTPRRRLELMLDLLARIGALVKWDDTWVAWNRMVLQSIALTSSVIPTVSGSPDLSQMAQSAARDMALGQLHYDMELVRRYMASLLAKRFVILTGLSGSGKTKLAQAVAGWIASSTRQYEIVPVGAEWTGKEHILGYADALDPTKYSRTQALDLILRAEQEPEIPFFLILDEMNLSHVERYFADLLSTIESGEKLPLYSGEGPRDGVPFQLEKLPINLFIIGTVNVDETTYMFSPKVLDRANTIEFRVELDDIKRFLNNPRTVNLQVFSRSGLHFAESLVVEAQSEATVDDQDRQALECELALFFDVLKECGAEFGFRTVREIVRFVYFHKKLTSNGWELRTAIDAQILQKLLPRLQGSRKKLEPVLWALATLCYHKHSCTSTGEVLMDDGSNFREEVRKAIQLRPERDPLKRDEKRNYVFSEENAYYALSYKKIIRMLKLLEQGFTSFAEA